MIVTQQFINDFTDLIRQANGGSHLMQTTSLGQKESSMLPLLNEFTQRINQNITWKSEPPEPTDIDVRLSALFTDIKPEKQRKYAVAIKFLQKSIMGAGTHMFRALHAQPQNLSVKLSKSQQRFTTALVEGDAGHGLCLQMVLLWLKEQLSFHMVSNFPRLGGDNVVASKQARKVTKRAIAKAPDSDTLTTEAARFGLTVTKLGWNRNFKNIHESFDINPDVRTVLITLWNGRHALAMVQERSGSFLFYDSNAGSYRIQHRNLRDFLVTYNDTCLPLKWSSYSLPAVTPFSHIFSVIKTE